MRSFVASSFVARATRLVAALLLVPCALAQTYSVSGGPIPIPTQGSGGGGTWPTLLPPFAGSSSLTLPNGATTIERLTLLGMAHTWVGDVHLVLEDPLGGKHNVITRLGYSVTGGGAASDFHPANTIAIADGGIPFPSPVPSPVPAGVYKPHFGAGAGLWPSGNLGITNDPLSAIPVVPGGTYMLHAYDWAAADLGVVQSWSLEGSALGVAVNIDFDANVGAGAGAPSSSYAAAGLPGTWNVVPPFAQSVALVDVAGHATPITITGAGGIFAFDNPATTGDDEKLLDDIADPTGGSAYTVAGLPDGTYAVIVYAWGPDNPAFLTHVLVEGGSRGTQVCGGGAWTGAHVEGETFVKDTCIVSTGAITFRASAHTGFGSLNGVQIRQVNTSIDPQTYCVSGTSSNGCQAVLGFTGTPVAGASSGFVVTMTQGDGQRFGGLFYGLEARNEPFGTGGATRCTTIPRQRMFDPVAFTGGTSGACDGVVTLDLAAYLATHPSALGVPFAAGETLYVQGWNRDNGNGSKNVATSNALKVTFRP